MATVSELKQQARALEQQGQVPKALAIYQHILKHLEGKPGLLRELPLYVKAGDLLLKLDDRDAAVGMYERAAEHYASHGSAKSVIALCSKVLRAVPQRTDVHLRFARSMMEREHVAAARDVLVAYADHAKLAKTRDALRLLTDRPDAEALPVLEMLLEAAAREERAATERTAERVSIQLTRIRDEPEPAPPPPQPVAEEPAVPAEPDEPEQEPPASEEEPDGVEELRGAPKPLGRGPVGVFDPTHTGTSQAHEPSGAGVGAERDRDVERPPRPSSGAYRPARPSRESGFGSAGEPRGVLVGEEERRPSKGKWIWGVAAAGAVVVGGVGLVVAGVIPIGGAGEQVATTPVPPARPAAPPPAVEDTTVAVSSAPADTVPPADDQESDTLLAFGGDTAVSIASADTNRQGSPLAIPDSLEGIAVAPDTGPQPLSVDPVSVVPVVPPLPPAPPVGGGGGGRIIMVDGLVVDRVNRSGQGGGGRYEVVQRLDSGEPLTLSVGPFDASVAAAGGVVVTSLPGDTSVATVPFAGYTVNARGLVNPDTLEALLGQLVQGAPPN